jgi:D-alanyl-D-alanine endopeptidase (penicillin-binding protein 7)
MEPRRSSLLAAEEPDFDSAGNPLLRSAAFYVQDVRTGQVLLEKNASSVLPIASITKLMTAMVVLDAHLPLNEVLEVSDDDVDRLKGTSSRLAVGTRMTREALLRLALMSSENRAASSLSRHYPGGQRVFIDAMNAKAQLLGMSDTRFYDGSGLNHGNVSSARDLATLVSNASHYPLIREFTTTAEYATELAGGRIHTFHNTNSLVRSPEWQIEVSKTGFINESGKCLVMQAWMANKPLAIVLLDSWGRFTRLADANRIRRWLEEVLPKNGAKIAGSPSGERISFN